MRLKVFSAGERGLVREDSGRPPAQVWFRPWGHALRWGPPAHGVGLGASRRRWRGQEPVTVRTQDGCSGHREAP